MASEIVEDKDWAATASISMKDDFYIELGVPAFCVGQSTMRDYAKQMSAWGLAALQMARFRGDNQGDPPGTFDGALAGAEFLMQLGRELDEAAAYVQEDRVSP